MDIVAFKLIGDYAHFSHPATIYSSLTYPVPPKTAIMGFLGAIIGEEEYYKLGDIKYSIKINHMVSKKTMIFNGIKFALSTNMHVKEGYQDASEKKQFYKEMIKNPEYIVFLNLENLDERYKSDIIANLREHKCKFTPYLGVNFCIADFEWIEIKDCFAINENDSEIDTFCLIDDFIFQNLDTRLTTARMACACEEGRIFKDFRDFVIEINTQNKIRSKNRKNIYNINGYKVYFV